MTGFPSVDKPWTQFYTEDELNAPIPHCTIYHSIYSNNKDHLNDTALLYFGQRISYGKMFDGIEKTAKAFTALGLTAGDNVALCMPALPETIYAILALNRLGVDACMLNPTFSVQQLIDRINELETTVLLVMTELYQVVEPVLPHTSIRTVICCSAVNSMNFAVKLVKSPKKIDGTVQWSQFIRQGADSVIPAPIPYVKDYPAVMVYSSGTTGASKGIQLTNDGINATLIEGNSVFPYMQRQDKYFIQVPIWFSTGISVTLLVSLYYGLTAMLEPLYDFKIFYKHITRFHPQYMVTATGLVDYLCSQKHYNKAYADFKCLAIGGEYVTSYAEKRFNKWLEDNGNHIPLQKGYGMCELGGTATAAAANRSNVIGSAGIPTPHVIVAAFDLESGKELPYGKRGELRVCTPCAMSGYYKRPAINEEFFHIDETGRKWACTGDMGYVDENGNVFVSGRIYDSYKDEAGNIVFLFDIERAILSIESVRQCKVVTTLINGKIYRTAHIVLMEETDPREIAAAIIKKCEETLPVHYRPHYIKIHADALPVAPSGKLNTKKMQDDRDQLIKIFEF